MRGAIKKRTGSVWNKTVEPKDDGFKATAGIVGQNLEQDVQTYANANNHYEGSVPLTSQRRLDVLRLGAA